MCRAACARYLSARGERATRGRYLSNGARFVDLLTVLEVGSGTRVTGGGRENQTTRRRDSQSARSAVAQPTTSIRGLSLRQCDDTCSRRSKPAPFATTKAAATDLITRGKEQGSKTVLPPKGFV